MRILNLCSMSFERITSVMSPTVCMQDLSGMSEIHRMGNPPMRMYLSKTSFSGRKRFAKALHSLYDWGSMRMRLYLPPRWVEYSDESRLAFDPAR